MHGLSWSHMHSQMTIQAGDTYPFFPCKSENMGNHVLLTQCIPVIETDFGTESERATIWVTKGEWQATQFPDSRALGLLLSFTRLFSFHPLSWLISPYPSIAPNPFSIFRGVLHHMTISFVFGRGMSPSLTWRQGGLGLCPLTHFPLSNSFHLFWALDSSCPN